ncbi:unknown protein [Desulfotalea psychrophila LSv54]|uniref:Uncharacterized protein n=1 Tax=Desulfotalea psychrophila (strain LSv54 / DSM 12343) TaxID=177439 RepID=Q6AMF4_DESPS|nr:unknown protein [Desulfotalea psychrophila LSv54]
MTSTVFKSSGKVVSALPVHYPDIEYLHLFCSKEMKVMDPATTTLPCAPQTPRELEKACSQTAQILFSWVSPVLSFVPMGRNQACSLTATLLHCLRYASLPPFRYASLLLFN